MARNRSSILGRLDSKFSALFTGETKGLRQENVIQDLTNFKDKYEHFLDYVLNDECYIDTAMGISLKSAKDYLERVRYSRATPTDQQSAENIVEYIKQQLITDIIVELTTGTRLYSTKSGRNVSQVLKLDYELCTQIANKYRGTQYQLNNGNPILSAADFELAYKQAIDIIYGTQHSGNYQTNRDNDIAIGIPRK